LIQFPKFTENVEVALPGNPKRQGVFSAAITTLEENLELESIRFTRSSWENGANSMTISRYPKPTASLVLNEELLLLSDPVMFTIKNDAEIFQLLRDIRKRIVLFLRNLAM